MVLVRENIKTHFWNIMTELVLEKVETEGISMSDGKMC